MEFVGANRPLYFIQRGKFKQISGERVSLGSPEFHKEGQRLKFKKTPDLFELYHRSLFILRWFAGTIWRTQI